MPYPSFHAYAEVLEIASILDCASTSFVARIRAQWQFGNRRHSVADPFMGAPDGASFMGHTGFSDFWCGRDPADSVRDAQAFFEVRLGVSCSRIQQQYGSLTIRLEHAFASRADQKTVGSG